MNLEGVSKLAREALRAMADACESFKTGVEDIVEETGLASLSFYFEDLTYLADLAEEDMAVPDGRDWQRDREREAIPREQARAAARYKAHRHMMTEHKARQHLRRRKYRSGANAGWY